MDYPDEQKPSKGGRMLTWMNMAFLTKLKYRGNIQEMGTGTSDLGRI